jgi:hypothetical protein
MWHCVVAEVWLDSGSCSRRDRMGYRHNPHVTPRLRTADRGLHVSA